MDIKNKIIMVALIVLTGCTSNYKCTDTFQKSTCMSIFNGISGGMEKHNQRMTAYRNVEAMDRFLKRMKGRGNTKSEAFTLMIPND